MISMRDLLLLAGVGGIVWASWSVGPNCGLFVTGGACIILGVAWSIFKVSGDDRQSS